MHSAGERDNKIDPEFIASIEASGHEVDHAN